MSDSPELARRRKLYMLAKEIGLSREDRLDLAEQVLYRDVESWKSLDDGDVLRLLDTISGYILITHLVRTSPPRLADTATS